MAVFSNDDFEVPAGHHVFIIEATSSLMIQEARASGGRSSGRVERWCTARDIQDARRQARAWADDIGEGIMIDDVRSDEAIILPSQTVEKIRSTFEFLAYQLGETIAGADPQPGDITLLQRDGGWIVGRYCYGVHGRPPSVGLLAFNEEPWPENEFLAGLRMANAAIHTSVMKALTRGFRLPVVVDTLPDAVQAIRAMLPEGPVSRV